MSDRPTLADGIALNILPWNIGVYLVEYIVLSCAKCHILVDFRYDQFQVYMIKIRCYNDHTV